MTNTDFGEPLDTTLGALQRKVRSDGWMADTKGVLKEDIEEGPIYVSSGDRFDSVRDLVADFQVGWEQTDHFGLLYKVPLRDAIKDTYPDWEFYEVQELMRELLDEQIWEAYHKENDTYDIADELLNKSKKDLNEVR